MQVVLPTSVTSLLALMLTGQALARQSPVADTLATRRVVGAAGERLDRMLRRFETYGFSGAVLVALNGSVVLLEGYGMADRERGIRNTPSTLFEMNSITKTLTGAAVLQLEERGMLRTNDSLARYLGRFPPAKAGTTIEHLATHTAGLVVDGTPLDGTGRLAFVESVKLAPIESRPGKRYRYTNAGFSVLAAVLEVASGQSYQSYVQKHLFTPAGMIGATFRGTTPGDSPLLARGYVGSPGDVRRSNPGQYLWGTIGAGGLVSTVGDVYRWVVALQDGAIISEASRQKMFVPRPVPREGYGWHMGPSPWGTTRIDKGGGAADFASHVLLFPDEKLVVVWANNDLRQRWRRTLNASLPALALGREATMPPPVARARTELTPFIGDYDTDAGVVSIRSADEYLYARRNRAEIPDNVMFFPLTSRSFSAFDPATMETMTLRFDRQAEGPLIAEFRTSTKALKLQKRL